MLRSLSFLIMMIAGSAFRQDLNLPDPLRMEDGTRVTTSEMWENHRRPEVLELFRTHVYGRRPVDRPADLAFSVDEVAAGVMGGRADRKEVSITFSGLGGEGSIRAVIYLPAGGSGVPAFLLINHRSLETMEPEREEPDPFWPAELIVERGYAAVVFNVADVDPDTPDGYDASVRAIFDLPATERAGDAWAAISAWGWGASRVLDYLEVDEDIDAGRVAVIGHSRGGKAALWAAAEDERFRMAVSNNSGNSGAALARRNVGESVADINAGFPYWFADNYNAFNDRETDLPVDQHMLIGLIAPRLVYISSATDDEWADPEGEYLGGIHAGPVFGLYGLVGLAADEMPPPESPVHDGSVGYHLRTGPHDLTPYDWIQFIDFADLHM